MRLNIRKHWKGWLIGGVIVVVALVIGVPYAYIHLVEGNQPPPLALSNGTPTGVAIAPATGTWKVSSGSQAGYRVHETLAGQSVTAVGRGDGVTGSIVVLGNDVTSGNFTLDMSTVTSDKSQRDNQFRNQIMETSKYRTGTFALSRPISLGSIPAVGKQVTAQATGELTLHGVTRPVTFPVSAVRNGDTIQVQGSIPVTFADYGVQAPNFAGFVTVDNSGQVEFLLDLKHA